MRWTRSAAANASRRTSLSARRPSATALVDARQVLLDDRARAEVEVPDLAVAHLALGQPDGPAAGGQLRVRIARPEVVEDGRLGERDALPGPSGATPQPSSTTRQPRGRRYVTQRGAASTIAANAAGSSEAPPTSAPSTSGSASSSAAFSALTSRRRGCRARSACSLVAVADERADEADRLLGLLGRGDLAGADRPDRLVGDDHVGRALVGHPLEALLDLVAQLALGVAALALLLGLADAEDRHEAGVERGRDLLRRARGRSRRRAARRSECPSTTPCDAELGEHRRARPRR